MGRIPRHSSDHIPVTALLILCERDTKADQINRTEASFRKAFGAARPVIVVPWDQSGANALAPGDRRPGTDSGPTHFGQHGYALVLFAGSLIDQRLFGLEALCGSAAPGIVYWDQDRLDDQGAICDPWFKPAWDEVHFADQDFITGACAIRTKALERACGSVPWTTARVAEAIATVALHGDGAPPLHVPGFLIHTPIHQPLLALRARPDFRPAPDLDVTIIIPTRDQPQLLSACVAGAIALEYPGQKKIFVVNNRSEQRETMDLFADFLNLGVQVLDYNHEFNFSAINNFSVECSDTEYVLFLNNDIEVIDPFALIKMMSVAKTGKVGAIGAQLLYPDGTIQHAGVAIGIGGAAGHMMKGMDAVSTARHGLQNVTRRATAVTAASMLINRETFIAIGGFDEDRFPVAFNDVDLCLRLDRAGYRNIYVGDARFVHHESKSRGSDYAPQNRERFAQELAALQERWDTGHFCDPCYHPFLSRRSEGYYSEL